MIETRRARFATTSWSLVRRAQAGSSEALAALLEGAWYPIYVYYRRNGLHPEDAEDLTQELFGRLHEEGFPRKLDPDRGRLRAYVLACARHLMANERERGRAKRRGGGRAPLSLSAAELELRLQRDGSPDSDPERAFERRWAVAVLERVMARLRSDLSRKGMGDQLDRLKGYLGAGRVVPYRDLAAAMGTTEEAVRVAVHRLRRRYRDALRQEIALTISDPAEIDAEIRYLFDALAV